MWIKLELTPATRLQSQRHSEYEKFVDQISWKNIFEVANKQTQIFVVKVKKKYKKVILVAKSMHVVFVIGLEKLSS